MVISVSKPGGSDSNKYHLTHAMRLVLFIHDNVAKQASAVTEKILSRASRRGLVYTWMAGGLLLSSLQFMANGGSLESVLHRTQATFMLRGVQSLVQPHTPNIVYWLLVLGLYAICVVAQRSVNEDLKRHISILLSKLENVQREHRQLPEEGIQEREMFLRQIDDVEQREMFMSLKKEIAQLKKERDEAVAKLRTENSAEAERERLCWTSADIQNQLKQHSKESARKEAILKTERIILSSVLESERRKNRNELKALREKHEGENGALLHQLNSSMGKFSRIVNRKNKEIEALTSERDELFDVLVDVEGLAAGTIDEVADEDPVTTSTPLPDSVLFVDEDGPVIKLLPTGFSTPACHE